MRLEGRVIARFRCSTTIKRPVEDVFTVLSNPANDPTWSSAVVEAEQTSTGPIGVGTTARFVSKLLGRRIETKWEITEFEPNQRFVALTNSRPFPVQVSMTFEPIEGGTRVGVTYEAEPGGFFKLAVPLFVGMGKRQLQSALDNLKGLMEANAL
jgi:uncharacterized protein YndB with AHSA1/START domain